MFIYCVSECYCLLKVYKCKLKATDTHQTAAGAAPCGRHLWSVPEGSIVRQRSIYLF